jgi:hypothetical protein
MELQMRSHVDRANKEYETLQRNKQLAKKR